MTITEQKTIANELINRVRDDILRNMGDVPSSWNGIELRQYIADRFAREAFPKMTGARMRNYRNTIAVTPNL